MKKPDRRLVGLLLVAAAIACAAAYHWVGPGLVTTDHPPTPPAAVAQGITLTERTNYRFALIPLTALGIAGFLMAIIPQKAGSSVAIRFSKPMKILNVIPRRAFIVFFWVAILTATVCLGSIIAFLALMPDNEHGRRGISTAFRAFSPGFLVAVLIAGASYRVLRATKKTDQGHKA